MFVHRMKCIAVVAVIIAQQIARKKLGRTSGDKEDSGKKGRGASLTERRQEVQDEREVMPCARTQTTINGLI